MGASGRPHRMRPITVERLWELSGLNRTLPLLRPITSLQCVQCVASELVREGRWAATATSFEWDTWRSSSDRTQRPDASGAHDLRVRSSHNLPSEGVTASLARGAINRSSGQPLAGS